jgi:WD domain, G-beta repeat
MENKDGIVEWIDTLEGHTSIVMSVAFSSDNTRIVSASYDKTIRIWSVSDGKCLHTLKGHTSTVMSVAISSDNTRIVSGSDDQTIRIWSVSDGKCLHTLEGHTSIVMSVAISSDNTRIVSGSSDKTIRIWSVSDGKCLHTLKGHTSTVMSVAISSDNTRIVSGSNDNTIRIWSVSDGKCLHTLEGHTNWVRSVAISSDNTRIVSGSSDRTIRIWSYKRALDATAMMSVWTDSNTSTSDIHSVSHHAFSSKFSQDSSMHGYPRDRTLTRPSAHHQVKDRACPIEWEFVSQGNMRYCIIVHRNYSSFFSTKTAVHNYAITAQTTFECSDPFVRSASNPSVTSLTEALSFESVCDMTIDVFGNGRTTIRTIAGAIEATALCGFIAWAKFVKAWPVLSEPTCSQYVPVLCHAVLLSHFAIPPSQEAAVQAKLSSLEAEYKSALQAMNVDEGKIIDRKIRDLEAVRVSASSHHRKGHLQLCSKVRKQLNDMSSELSTRQEELHQSAMQCFEKKQFDAAKKQQAEASDMKSLSLTLTSVAVMLDSHLDSEFLPQSRVSDSKSTATANGNRQQHHADQTASDVLSGVASAAHGIARASDVVSGVASAAQGIARTNDILSGVASAARILSDITPIIGSVFQCIATIASTVSTCLTNFENVKLLADRCGTVESFVSQVQSHIESSDSLRTDANQLRVV